MPADPRLLASLDLMRRLPPSRVESSLEELVDLAPDLTDDLLNTIDQPLQVAQDSEANMYLLCDYNRDGDSYRSPITNKYDPPLEDGVLPPEHLRALEQAANDVFGKYREVYYEGGVSSVYFWEVDDAEFAACILFKKDVGAKKKGLEEGKWDAIHVVEARKAGSSSAPTCKYKLTSTVMLQVATDHKSEGSTGGSLRLSGSMTRQKVSEASAKNGHLPNIGRMIEEMENGMRDSLQSVYFGRTRNVVGSLYKLGGSGLERQRDDLAKALRQQMSTKA